MSRLIQLKKANPADGSYNQWCRVGGVFVNVVSRFLASDLALKGVKTKQVFFFIPLYSVTLEPFLCLSSRTYCCNRIDNKDAIERMIPLPK